MTSEESNVTRPRWHLDAPGTGDGANTHLHQGSPVPFQPAEVQAQARERKQLRALRAPLGQIACGRCAQSGLQRVCPVQHRPRQLLRTPVRGHVQQRRIVPQAGRER